MKRREFLKLSATLTGAAMTVYLPAGWTPAKAADKKKVGFSQATTLEPWRVQFNKDIEAEAKNHPEIELIITDGQDKTEKQVADVENLIAQQVDVLLISPKESAGLTGVVEKAIDAKIPVIVLDRNVDTKRITQFIGGDNALIGKAAGEYAVKLLGGPGNATGNVVEIWGGMGTQPAHDRHDGFHAFTDKEPGIKYLLNNQSGDWKQDKAYDIMTTALRNNEKIDLVYGHNDPMAYGAYLAAKDAGRDKDIKFFIGIDALPDEGVTWVHKGELTATFLYATPGAEGLRQAVKLLNGEKIPPVITLPTMLVDKNNADEIHQEERPALTALPSESRFSKRDSGGPRPLLTGRALQSKRRRLSRCENPSNDLALSRPGSPESGPGDPGAVRIFRRTRLCSP